MPVGAQQQEDLCRTTVTMKVSIAAYVEEQKHIYARDRSESRTMEVGLHESRRRITWVGKRRITTEAKPIYGDVLAKYGRCRH